MKRRFVKELAVLAVLAVAGRAMPAYAGWQQQADCWKYEEDGGWITESWVKENDGWYYLGAEGKMETGWKQTGGFWYFLNPVRQGACGRMLTGWQWIDGRCYYLADGNNCEYPEGAMYVNGQTPDGYWVDESGAWVDARGDVVEILGKGILTGSQAESKESRAVPAGGGSKSGGRSSGRSKGGYSRSGGGSGDSSSGIASGYSRSGQNSAGSRDNSEGKSGEEGSGRDEISQGSDSRDSQDRNDREDNQDEGVRGESQDQGIRNDGSLEIETPGHKATDSNAMEVNWQIRFVDRDTHQTLLAETRQGQIKDGEKLILNFRNRIVDQEQHVWESAENPPLELEVYGPGDRIYYVEYIRTGQLDEPEDPFLEARNRLKSWLEMGKQQEAALTGEAVSEIPDSRILVGDSRETKGRLLTIFGRLPFEEEHAVYLIGKNHEPEGTALKNYYGDSVQYSKLREDQFFLDRDVYTVARFSVKRVSKLREEETGERTETDFGEAWEKAHWNVGDVLTGEIDGECYRFRCIDQNYSDLGGNHQEGALFLCDCVIPANTGSSYIYEPLEDKTYGYVFCPGPAVNFGDGNDYKYSNIRRWLKTWEENFHRARDIDIGVSFAYMGSTGQGMYDQLLESDLKAYPIGNQKLTGKLFILSVEEALKYRDWLWSFDGSRQENSLSQTGAFSKGYWLRSPVGTSENHNTGLVYGVDLENGRICPVKVRPDGTAEEKELCVTSSMGIRPAFVMPQQ